MNKYINIKTILAFIFGTFIGTTLDIADFYYSHFHNPNELIAVPYDINIQHLNESDKILISSGINIINSGKQNNNIREIQLFIRNNDGKNKQFSGTQKKIEITPDKIETIILEGLFDEDVYYDYLNDTFTTKVGIRTEVLTQKGLIINSENDIADSYLGKKSRVCLIVQNLEHLINKLLIC